jgi:hypothetical protein
MTANKAQGWSIDIASGVEEHTGVVRCDQVGLFSCLFNWRYIAV